MQHWTVQAFFATSETRGTVDLHLEANDLQPHSTQLLWSAGPVSKGSSIDVCGRPMNHFNGRSPAFHPSAAVFQARQGGRVNKLEKKQSMARTGRTPLNCCSHSTAGQKRGEVLGWPVGTVTGGQFVKQRETLVVLLTDEGGKPITICKTIPESFSIISASSLLPHLALFSKMKIETYERSEIMPSRPHSVLCYSKEGLVLYRRGMNERRSWSNGWWIHEYLISKAFVEIKSIFGQCWRSQL